MQAIPEDGITGDEPEDEAKTPDERVSIRASDKRISANNELSDSEDEGDGRRDQRSYKNRKRLKQEDNGTTENKPLIEPIVESNSSATVKDSSVVPAAAEKVIKKEDEVPKVEENGGKSPTSTPPKPVVEEATPMETDTPDAKEPAVVSPSSASTTSETKEKPAT
jgi:histone deacetylase 1/2